MKWGSKHANGCKDLSCPRVHPQLCLKSLDLKCLDKQCPVRLHASKCVRWRPPNSGGEHHRGGGLRGSTSTGGPWASERGGNPAQPWCDRWQTRTAPPLNPWSGSRTIRTESLSKTLDFPKLTVQQMLEAQQKQFRDMMLQFQQQMHQSLEHQYQVAQQVQGGVQGQGVWGLHSRPFSLPTSSA